jgi:hypothetical protein
MMGDRASLVNAGSGLRAENPSRRLDGRYAGAMADPSPERVDALHNLWFIRCLMRKKSRAQESPA